MPLYEYYCSDCNGVFELLRPAKQAGDAQPQPAHLGQRCCLSRTGPAAALLPVVDGQAGHADEAPVVGR